MNSAISEEPFPHPRVSAGLFAAQFGVEMRFYGENSVICSGVHQRQLTQVRWNEGIL